MIPGFIQELLSKYLALTFHPAFHGFILYPDIHCLDDDIEVSVKIGLARIEYLIVQLYVASIMVSRFLFMLLSCCPLVDL